MFLGRWLLWWNSVLWRILCLVDGEHPRVLSWALGNSSRQQQLPTPGRERRLEQTRKPTVSFLREASFLCGWWLLQILSKGWEWWLNAQSYPGSPSLTPWPKAQGVSQKRGWEEFESWRRRQSAVEPRLLGMTRPLCFGLSTALISFVTEDRSTSHWEWGWVS